VSESVALIPAIFSRLAMARDVMLEKGEKEKNSRKSVPQRTYCVKGVCKGTRKSVPQCIPFFFLRVLFFSRVLESRPPKSKTNHDLNPNPCSPKATPCLFTEYSFFLMVLFFFCKGTQKSVPQRIPFSPKATPSVHPVYRQCVRVLCVYRV
jgi:hypothetical protein